MHQGLIKTDYLEIIEQLHQQDIMYKRETFQILLKIFTHVIVSFNANLSQKNEQG